jgi:hypothetical protein
VSDINCVDVTPVDVEDTGCMYFVNRRDKLDNITSTTEECLLKLKSENVSPYVEDQLPKF